MGYTRSGTSPGTGGPFGAVQYPDPPLSADRSLADRIVPAGRALGSRPETRCLRRPPGNRLTLFLLSQCGTRAPYGPDQTGRGVCARHPTLTSVCNVAAASTTNCRSPSASGYPDHGSSPDGSVTRHGRSSGSATRLFRPLWPCWWVRGYGCGFGILISSRIVVGPALTAPSKVGRTAARGPARDGERVAACSARAAMTRQSPLRSRQATSRLTCPARMSFTVINRFAMAHLHSHLAVVYHHDSPLLATSPHQLSHQTRRSEAEPQTSGSSRWGRPVTCDFSAGHAVGYRLSSVVRPVSLGGGRAAGRAGRDARAGRAASGGLRRPVRGQRRSVGGLWLRRRGHRHAQSRDCRADRRRPVGDRGGGRVRADGDLRVDVARAGPPARLGRVGPPARPAAQARRAAGGPGSALGRRGTFAGLDRGPVRGGPVGGEPAAGAVRPDRSPA